MDISLLVGNSTLNVETLVEYCSTFHLTLHASSAGGVAKGVNLWRPSLLILDEHLHDLPAWKLVMSLRRYGEGPSFEVDGSPLYQPHVVILSNAPSKRGRALCAEVGANEYIGLVNRSLVPADVRQWIKKAEVLHGETKKH